MLRQPHCFSLRVNFPTKDGFPSRPSGVSFAKLFDGGRLLLMRVVVWVQWPQHLIQGLEQGLFDAFPVSASQLCQTDEVVNMHVPVANGLAAATKLHCLLRCKCNHFLLDTEVRAVQCCAGPLVPLWVCAQWTQPQVAVVQQQGCWEKNPVTFLDHCCAFLAKERCVLLCRLVWTTTKRSELLAHVPPLVMHQCGHSFGLAVPQQVIGQVVKLLDVAQVSPGISLPIKELFPCFAGQAVVRG